MGLTKFWNQSSPQNLETSEQRGGWRMAKKDKTREIFGIHPDPGEREKDRGFGESTLIDGKIDGIRNSEFTLTL